MAPIVLTIGSLSPVSLHPPPGYSFRIAHASRRSPELAPDPGRAPRTGHAAGHRQRQQLHRSAFRRPTCAFISGHQRKRIYTPRYNGKIERYQQVLADQRLYARPYGSETERRHATTIWAHHYIFRRPHTGCADQPPGTHVRERVDNVMTSYT